MSPKGFYTKNTQTSSQVVPIIKQLMNGDFSQVKILENPQDKKTHVVTIKKATGLASFDSNGFSDPFVIFKINGKEVGKTKIIKKTLNPEWNESFKLNLHVNDELEFRLNDYDHLSFDDFMGTSILKIDQNLVQSYNHEGQLSLLDK